LLIGVKDNGKISGIRSEEEFYMLDNAASRYCDPQVEFQSKEWNIEGKRVLEVTIKKGSNLPYRAPDHNLKMRAYVRIKDQNILANGVQMKIWQKLNTNSDIRFVYSDDAKRLLELFNNSSLLSLNQILSEIQLSRYKIENLLSNLVIMKVITMEVNDLEAFFVLNDPNKSS
jgi:predicted HTH transcriptional regulator